MQRHFYDTDLMHRDLTKHNDAVEWAHEHTQMQAPADSTHPG